MRFILLAISVFFTSNTYAAIVSNSYIYSDDSNKDILFKERVKVAEERFVMSRLYLFKNHRKASYDGYDKDEVVYKVGDISKKDIGAKIGMSEDQVLNKTYWGKPEGIYTEIDSNNKLVLWAYNVYGPAYNLKQTEGLLFFINGKLAHIIQ